MNLWDLRKLGRPWTSLQGHKYAVRKVRFSPHHPTALMSASYDMTTVLWDYSAIPNPLIARYKHHSEFAVGLGYNLFVENLVASAGWDEKVAIFSVQPILKKRRQMPMGISKPPVTTMNTMNSTKTLTMQNSAMLDPGKKN